MAHVHEHILECEHDCLHYCEECGDVFCCDCDKEWHDNSQCDDVDCECECHEK